MDFKYQINGAAELERLLKLLPGKVATKIGEGAVRAGANLLKKEVVAQAPEHLKDTIVVRKKKGRSRKTVSAVEYTLGSTSQLAHFDEFGVRPHKIVAGKSGKKQKSTGRKVLADGGGKFFGSEVNHPGVRAKPFFRPAIDANFQAYLQRVGDIIAKGLVREGAKFATFGSSGKPRRRGR